MKSFQMLFAALAMIVMMLAGCGSETKTVYVTAETGAKLSITGANTQQIQLEKNADGSLKDLDYGSLKVMPEDVEYFAYSSDKVGYYQNSRVKAVMSSEGLVKFEEMPNGDSGIFIAVLKNGDTCEVITNRNVATYKPMFYSVSGSNWYTYGRDLEPFADMEVQNGTLYIHFSFACDQLIGTMPYVKYQEGTKLIFISSVGTIYEGSMVQDQETGNLNGNISFPLPDSMNVYNQREVRGRFYAVLPSGMTSELNFDWSKSLYTWYLRSSGNLYQSYDEGASNVVITQYQQF